MSTLGQLQRGYYADLRRYPFHNPAKGGLDWFGEGRGCNTLAFLDTKLPERWTPLGRM